MPGKTSNTSSSRPGVSKLTAATFKPANNNEPAKSHRREMEKREFIEWSFNIFFSAQSQLEIKN
jgi:hypothetical protein